MYVCARVSAWVYVGVRLTKCVRVLPCVHVSQCHLMLCLRLREAESILMLSMFMRGSITVVQEAESVLML